MTGVKLKEQYISYLPLLQTLNNISVIMLLCTFNIISLILDMRKGDYVITLTFSIEGLTCRRLVKFANETYHRKIITRVKFSEVSRYK